MKKLFTIAVFALIGTVTALADTYTNPVIMESLPDPTVIRGHDGWFYIYATEDRWNVPIYRSRDLVHWSAFRNAFTDDTRPRFIQQSDGTMGGSVWAPDINYINGQYVLYFAYSQMNETKKCGIGVAVADNPCGPFHDTKSLFNSTEIGVTNSIDPNYFEDTDGKKYLIWGSFNGLYITELTDDGLNIKDKTKKTKIANSKSEAPYMIKHGGYYYLFTSTGGFAADGKYTLSVARCDKLIGTYKNKNGDDVTKDLTIPSWSPSPTVVLKGDNTVALSPGHCSEIITDDNGTDWILHHGYSKNDVDGGRRVWLEKITWGSDGWPTVGGGTACMAGGDAPVFAQDTAEDYLSKLTKKDENTFYISNAYELEYFSRLVNEFGYGNYNIELTDDIDFAGCTWPHTAIGADSKDHRFSGTCEGNGHHIKNMKMYAYMNDGSVNDQGLFGVGSGGAEIRNLIIDSSCDFFTKAKCSSAFMGCCNFTDYGNTITFENCGNEANVLGNGANNAIFVGCNYGGTGLKLTFKNCYNTGSITGGWENGIFSGWLGGWGDDNQSSIVNCWSTGQMNNGIDDVNTFARGIYGNNLINSYDLCTTHHDGDDTNITRHSRTIYRDYSSTWLGSGRWAYLMNGNQSSINWYHTVGTDSHPFPLNTHNRVQMFRADANRNGKINVADVSVLVRDFMATDVSMIPEKDGDPTPTASNLSTIVDRVLK